MEQERPSRGGSTRPNASPLRLALRGAGIYLIAAVLLILLSDRALEAVAPNHEFVNRMQSYKGLFFVIVTSGALYAILYTSGVRRTKAEHAVRVSEAIYRGSFNAGTVGMAQANAQDGRLLCVNRKMCEITGYEESELVGMPFSTFTHPDDRDRNMAAFPRMAAGESPTYESEKRYVRKDGSIVWVLVSATLIDADDDGDLPQRTVAVIKDITERKMAQEQLRTSEARFRELAEAMPQVVFTADANGVPDYLNQRYRDYTQTSLDTPMSLRQERSLHPDDRQFVREAWATAVRDGTTFDVEFRFRRASDGAYRWHLSRAVPTRDAAGRVVKWFGTMTDVHDQKEAVEQVHQMNETLEQRVRARTAELQAANDDLNAYTYTVSHDLRAPLASLQGFARTALERYGDRLGDDGQETMRRMVAATARMDRLIIDLLEFSRLARVEPNLAPVSTVTIVHELIGQLNRQPLTAGAKVAVHEPLPWVMGHRLMLQHVMSSLVGNAIKFVKPGEPSNVTIWSEPRGKAARVWVEDRGIGIAPQDIDRIFNPFETVHDPAIYPGAGIGLAVVKRSVERMGGHVGVESSLGNGSRFWFELATARGISH